MLRRLLATALALLLAPWLAACGGGSGSGGGGPAAPGSVTEMEPNNTSGTATPLVLGQAGLGAIVAAGEIDFWSFTVPAASYVNVRCYAARLDQATWDAVPNNAVITLFAPDGTTKIAEHDWDGDVLAGAGSGGRLDPAFECVRLDAAGTYFVRVAQDVPASMGGSYALVVKDVVLAGVQIEPEAEGATGGNDTPGSADMLIPGVMQGSVTAGGGVDVYSFQVAGVPAIVDLEAKAWRQGASGGSTEYARLRLELIATDAVTVLASTDNGYGFDALFSQAITAAGLYYVRVTELLGGGGAGMGRYTLHFDLQQVGAINEVEANETAGTANAMSEGQFVNGMIAAGDTDFFSFSAVAGDLRSIRIWDVINHDATTAALTLAVFAPDGVTPVPATPPNTNSGLIREARFQVRTSGTHFVRVTAGGAAQPYILRNLTTKTAAIETEPNDMMGSADPLNAGLRAAGAIGAPGDQDWYQISAAADELVSVDCFAFQSSTGADFLRFNYGSALLPVVEILDNMGMVIATATRSPPNATANPIDYSGRIPSVTVSFVAPTGGVYFVRVGAVGGASGSASHTYLIERR